MFIIKILFELLFVLKYEVDELDEQVDVYEENDVNHLFEILLQYEVDEGDDIQVDVRIVWIEAHDDELLNLDQDIEYDSIDIIDDLEFVIIDEVDDDELVETDDEMCDVVIF